MKIRAALSFAAFGVIILFAFSYFAAMGLRIGPLPQRTNISMDVADINGLVVGSSVQLRGVPIGEVQKITSALAGATVNFYVDNRFKIPQDSDVRLENLSALGEAYIELLPRSTEGPVWRDGERLATTAVDQPPSISELATSVVRALSQLDPGALKRIVAEADAALPSPTTTLPNLARTSTLLRDTAANMNGKGRDLLDNFQTLLRNADFVGPVLAFNTPYVTKIGQTLNPLFDCIAEGYNRGGPQTLKNFAHFVARIEHLIDNSHGDIKVLLQSMLPYLNDISGALMNLDTSQVFANMLAAVPEDGAVTLHVTIPDTGVPEESAGAPPATAPAAVPEQPPLTGAPTAPPHPGSAGVFIPRAEDVDPNAPPESVLSIPQCHAVYPTATAPAPHADATPRSPGQPFPIRRFWWAYERDPIRGQPHIEKGHNMTTNHTDIRNPASGAADSSDSEPPRGEDPIVKSDDSADDTVSDIDSGEDQGDAADLAPVDEEKDSRNRSPRRLSISVSARSLLYGVVIVALVAAAATFGWLYFDARQQLGAQHRTATDNAHAEKIALDYAVNAATMNFQDLNGWKVKLVAGTSPELNDKLTKAASSMEQILVPLQWNSTSQPLAAKVRSVTNGIYVVDCFVSVQTKTVQAPEPLASTATYSLTIDSAKNWQITDVGGIGSVLGQN